MFSLRLAGKDFFKLVAARMCISCSEWEAPTKRLDTIGSSWTGFSSRETRAFCWHQSWWEEDEILEKRLMDSTDLSMNSEPVPR